MIKTAFTITSIFLTVLTVSARQGSSSPAPPSRQAPIVRREISPGRVIQEQVAALEENRIALRDANHEYLGIRRDINALYRKTNKKDLTLVAPDSTSSAKFGSFLKQEKTGLIKLLPNAECVSDLSVVAAADNCLKYAFPGAGAAYSFRTSDYRIDRLSDLIFDGESFLSNGVWSQGIIVAVGDVPLEQLNLQNRALKYLIDFQPSMDQAKAGEDQQKLINGVKANGFTYAQALGAVENMTYALRSIAYRGNFYREYKGLVYDELSYDKRKDIVVAFKVIEKDSDGGVTILWKELSSKESPKFVPKKPHKKS